MEDKRLILKINDYAFELPDGFYLSIDRRVGSGKSKAILKGNQQYITFNADNIEQLELGIKSLVDIVIKINR